jgi:hypothetical protein
MTREISMQNAVNLFIKDRYDYFKQWIFDEPIVISQSHHLNLARLQKVMYKLIVEFVTNFEKYQDEIVISDKTREIIRELKDVPYEVGTYRTDFVYDKQKQPKIIEITCRFALNTLFLNSIMSHHSNEYHRKFLKGTDITDNYKKLFPYLLQLSKGGNIYVLKGRDAKNESAMFKKVFEDAGIEVTELHYMDISKEIHKMEDAWIVTELTLDEIESLDLSIIKKLSQLNLINDFRTVLLIHDKQFFSVLGKKTLQESCLSVEEMEFFKNYYIPTYHRNEYPEYWADAQKNKDKWILKHKALGKSKSVYAGLVTDEDVWEDLFENEENGDLVLQEWIPQNKMQAQIGNEKYEDYVTGTLLFVNNNYFGLGPFRTSSHPVTNVVDDRKAVPLVLAENIENAGDIFINYINS